MNTPPNEADIESKAIKLYTVFVTSYKGRPNWGAEHHDYRTAWRKVALYVLTNES